MASAVTGDTVHTESDPVMMEEMPSVNGDIEGPVKPWLRGRIHLAALVAAIPAAIALIVVSGGSEAKVAASAYGATLVLLFAASSAYHRLGHSGRALVWLRRLDHSSIFLLIAGSYTPVCLVALSGWWSGTLLVAVWTAAVGGVVLKLVRFEQSHRLGFALYLMMGWAVLAALPALLRSVDRSTLVLLVVGGLLYTVGAVVLATRFPNPFPRVFGYHEVWHAMVVVAASLHYVAIRGMVV
jgi:hemolysin III